MVLPLPHPTSKSFEDSPQETSSGNSFSKYRLSCITRWKLRQLEKENKIEVHFPKVFKEFHEQLNTHKYQNSYLTIFDAQDNSVSFVKLDFLLKLLSSTNSNM